MKPVPNRLAFSEENPELQIAWDSTSLGCLKTCAYLYYLRIIQGWTPRNQSIHLTFGLYFHEGIEHYAAELFRTGDFDTAVEYMVKTMLERTGERIDDVWFPWVPDPLDKAVKLKNRFTLIRALVWYTEHFKDDALSIVALENGKPATELSFRITLPIHAPTGEDHILCGHLDLLAQAKNGSYWVLDHKTTKSALSSYFWNQFTPNNQMSLYTFAGQVVLDKPISGVIVNGVQLAVNFARFARQEAHRTTDQIDDWYEDMLHYIELANSYAEKKFYPQNDTVCTMYGGCDFQDICAKSAKVREQFLKANFVQDFWDPLEIR